MESIAEILNSARAEKAPEVRRPSQASKWQTTEPEERYVLSDDPELKRFKPPEPVPCEYCGAKRYTEGYYFDDKRILWNPKPQRCTCSEAVAAYEAEQAAAEAAKKAAAEQKAKMRMLNRVSDIISHSGMSARFLRRTFATFQVTEQNRKPLRVCQMYADTFKDKLPTVNPEPGRNGLFITGPKGTGKTHLAAAIANKLMQEGHAVICMTMIELLDRIKQTYEQQRQWGITESSVLSTYKEVPLLIIDDMGKEPATEWAVSKIYAIINARYEAYLPTIITTNYSDSELVQRLTPKDSGDPTTADATIDRLREMCSAIVTTGDSWRSK